MSCVQCQELFIKESETRSPTPGSQQLYGRENTHIDVPLCRVLRLKPSLKT